MKKRTYLNEWILTLLFCFSSIYAFSQLNRKVSERNAEEIKETKTITKIINAPTARVITIFNNSRPINIQTWDEQKVKLITTVIYNGKSNLTDNEWFDNLKIFIKDQNGNININSNTENLNRTKTGTAELKSGMLKGAVISSASNGKISREIKDTKDVLTIFVPSNCKLIVTNGYADLSFLSTIKDADVKINNGSLQVENIDHLSLFSKYSDFDGGNIKTADVEFSMGHFRVKQVQNLKIKSESSTILAEKVDNSTIQSINDEYDIEEADIVKCEKKFNTLRIGSLSSSLELIGSSADLKVKTMMSSVSNIRIENMYCNINLPLVKIQNFKLDFEGLYSKVYSDFEQNPVAVSNETLKKYPVAISGGVISGHKNNNIRTDSLGHENSLVIKGIVKGNFKTPPKFTAIVGTGEGANFHINCFNCSVDLK